MTYLKISILFLLLGCNTTKNNYFDGANNSINKPTNFKLILRTFDGCANIIEYDFSGRGTQTKGIVDNYDKTSYFFEKMIFEENFIIEKESIQNSIKKIIDHIYSEPTIKTFKSLDGNHIELIIGETKKIDSYRKTSSSYFDLYELIKKHLPHEINYDCKN